MQTNCLPQLEDEVKEYRNAYLEINERLNKINNEYIVKVESTDTVKRDVI